MNNLFVAVRKKVKQLFDQKPRDEFGEKLAVLFNEVKGSPGFSSEYNHPSLSNKDREKINHQILIDRKEAIADSAIEAIYSMKLVRKLRFEILRYMFFIITFFISSVPLLYWLGNEISKNFNYVFGNGVSTPLSTSKEVIYLTLAIVVIILSGLLITVRRIVIQIRNKVADANTQIKEILQFELRQAINEKLELSYRLRTNITDGAGLQEGYDPLLEIDTEAHKQLEQLLKKMRHGSIGITGPRGAGKTTLINSINHLDSVAGNRHLIVSISAPVNYRPREFLLYLFSKICETTIDATNLQNSDEIIRSLPVISYRVLLFLLLGLSIWFLGAIFGSPIKIIGIKINIVLEGLFLLSATGLFILSIYFSHLASNNIENWIHFLSANSNQEKEKNGVDFKWSHSKKVELNKKAENLLRKIHYQQTLSNSQSGAIKLTFWEAAWGKSRSIQENEMSLPEITFAYRDFIEWVTVNYGCKYLIGIDEMDKIENHDDAQKFLSELKNIFSLKNCYYLVSISQDAMSDFELRGLPFRDIFESTFDEVIHIPLLNYYNARTIITRRIIGLPEPFAELAYCLSGGSPRELIRYLRKIIIKTSEKVVETESKSIGQIYLHEMVFLLIKDDLMKKLVAIRYQLLMEEQSFSNTQFISRLDKFEEKITIDALIDFIHELIYENKKLRNDSTVLRGIQKQFGLFLAYQTTVLEAFREPIFEDDKAIEKFSNMAKQSFVIQKGEYSLNDSQNFSPIDTLVQARQLVGLSPKYSLSLISKFRQSQKMKPIGTGKKTTSSFRPILIRGRMSSGSYKRHL